MGVRVITGFEKATLKTILSTWLHSKNVVEVLRAAIEMRRRFASFNSLQPDNKDDQDFSV